MVLDIHPPARPLRSVLDFLMHLFTITCGILIALGLESVVERAHHRHAAHEAAVNLTREVADNHRGLTRGLANMAETRKQLEGILQTVRAIEVDRNAKHGDLSLSVSISSLSMTAWSTAATTGALAFMDRADVERFTGLYDLQQQFMSAQQHAVEALIELESWGELTGEPLTRISDAQTIEAERAAGRALAATRMAEDIGTSLNGHYGTVLAATADREGDQAIAPARP
jgi:hypothetical protein